MNHIINDRLMNPNVHGYSVMPFKLNGDRLPREDIPSWRIARTNARSMGKATFTHIKKCKCGSFERRVYDNTCYPCFKLERKK